MLSRKVVTRSGRGFRGHYPSRKLNRLVQFESILERDAIAFFEQSDEVVSFREQPELVYYCQDLEQKKYYPDFELVMVNGDVIHVEVKPWIHLLTLKLSKKYMAIQQHYLKRPEFFVILTENEIRNEQCGLKNLYELINNNYLSRNKGDDHDAILL